MNATEGKPVKDKVACHRQQRLGNSQMALLGQVKQLTSLFPTGKALLNLKSTFPKVS